MNPSSDELQVQFPYRPLLRFLAIQPAILFLLGVCGYLLAFSTYREIDDEGLFMQCVRFSLDGAVLYDEVVVPFGPTYYLDKRMAHGVLGLPLTNDGVRWHTLAVWLAMAFVAAVFVYRLTGSGAIAIACQCATFFCLRSVTNEPGHPQELVGLLLVLTAGLSLLWVRAPNTTALALGMAAALLLFTKLNSGVFAIAAVGSTFAVLLRGHRPIGYLTFPILGLAVLLPWILMRERLDMDSVLRYAMLVSLSITATAWISTRQRMGNASAGLPGYLAAGFLAAAVALISWALVHGSSLAGMWHALVLLPAQHTGSYYLPLIILPVGIHLALCATLTALLAGWALRNPDGRESGMSKAWLGGLKLCFGVSVLVAAVGLQSVTMIHALLLHFAIPWLWLLLIPSSGRSFPVAEALPRLVLCWLALMHSLYIYPVAGSQKALSVFLMVLVAAICFHDGLVMIAGWKNSLGGFVQRYAPAGLVVLCLGFSAMHLQSFRAQYAARVPLSLPGARLMRVPEEDAVVYRELVSALRESSDTFLCSDGFNSLYLWTELKPPSRMIVFHDLGSAKMHWYDASQQRLTLDGFFQHRRAAYVVTRRRDSEFFRQLQARTELWKRIGRFEIRLRKPSPSEASRHPDAP